MDLDFRKKLPINAIGLTKPSYSHNDKPVTLGDKLKAITIEVNEEEKQKIEDFDTWLVPFLSLAAQKGKNECKIPDNYYFNRFFDVEKLDKWCKENALKLIKQYRNEEDSYRNDWYKLIIRW